VKKSLINFLIRTNSITIVLALIIGTPAFAAPNYTIAAEKEGYLNVYKQSHYNTLQTGTHLADKDLYDKAVPYFKKALEENPTSVIAQFNLGYSLMQTATETTSHVEAQKRLEEAEWAFLRVRDLNPDLTITYYKLGKLALIREDYQAAAEYYDSGVQSNPDNYALMFNLAAAYEKLNKLDKAEATYQKAIEINPQFVYAHNNLGLLYEQTDRSAKAEAVYREALKQVPEYNYARLNLGSMLQNQGRLDEAEGIYKDAIDVEPDNAWAHLYLGNTYYRKGMYSDALDCYQQVMLLNPKYPTTYYLASLALQKLNRTDEAIANSLQYISLAPDGAFSQEAGELVLTLQQSKQQAIHFEKH
jgi:tetratricopeptide (TPR) repeat protein